MSDNTKRFWFIIFILVLIASYNDLQRESASKSLKTDSASPSYYDQDLKSFQVISYKIQQGDQFLTIIERVNEKPMININSIIADFQSLNPSADIYDLKIGRVYLFPVY